MGNGKRGESARARDSWSLSLKMELTVNTYKNDDAKMYLSPNIDSSGSALSAYILIREISQLFWRLHREYRSLCLSRPDALHFVHSFD